MTNRANLLMPALLLVTLLGAGAGCAPADRDAAAPTAPLGPIPDTKAAALRGQTPPASGAPTGACNFPDMTCQILTAPRCRALRGDFLGAGTVCAETGAAPPALPGACVFRNATCRILDSPKCEVLRGVFLGEGTTCKPNTLPRAGR
jgi:hypothetical protein